MKIDGWTLREEVDDYGDGKRKLERWAVHDDGREVKVDFWPYEPLRAIDFERLIALGFPGGALTQARLEELWTLTERARGLRRRIAELRIDHPEAADRRRLELLQVEQRVREIRGERS